MAKLAGLYILDESTRASVYGPEQHRAIEQHVEWVGPAQTRETIQEQPRLLRDVEVIFSGWTPPAFDDAFLDRSPRLRAIFYAAGAMNASAAGRRGIVVTTAHQANSKPVAEYTLATILFSLKHGWRLAREARDHRTYKATDRDSVPGTFGTTVGLVGMGAVSRLLLPLLKPFDLNVVAYDPALSSSEAARLGVERVGLAEVFDRSHVVSLHAAQNPETRGLIGLKHFALMREGATFINTARGGIVRESDLIAVAARRPDLQFILDVTDPVEPPVRESPLYTLPNVVLTPHLAGSAGGECRRLGECMVEELRRYVRGEPLRWAVPNEQAEAATRNTAADPNFRPSPSPRHRYQDRSFEIGVHV